MDGVDQVEAYAAADFNASDQAMVERLAALCAESPGPRLVDLGCGPGNISFLLARRWPEAAVLGLDGAPRMLAVAEQRLVEEPELGGRLRFAQALLPLAESTPLAGSFSAVVSNSLLHHLHDPGVLWRSLRQLAAPGAAVIVRDLRRPTAADELEALVALHAATAPAVLRRDFALSLRAAFRVGEVEEQLRREGLGGLAVRELDDRYLEVAGRLD